MKRNPALLLSHRCKVFAAAIASCFVAEVAWSAVQSPLAPHGANASQTAELAWAMFLGGAVITIAVMAILIYVVLARRRRPAWLSGQRLVIAGGIAFPVTVLAALLPYTLIVSNRVTTSCTDDALRLEVTGEMWWWRVVYLDGDGKPALETANEIHVPVGRPVKIALATTDVIHGFWVPGLSGMLDMIPGRVNTQCFVADKPGILRGQCAEFCGAQHARMAIDVRVHEAQDFDAWFAAQLKPAVEPADEQLRVGQKLFVEHCASCHRVRGSAAGGSLGPDLTHVASRATLAAGTLPTNQGTLAAWIVSSQELKPGNRMPSFGDFTGAELTALAAYVANLQ